MQYKNIFPTWLRTQSYIAIILWEWKSK